MALNKLKKWLIETNTTNQNEQQPSETDISHELLKVDDAATEADVSCDEVTRRSRGFACVPQPSISETPVTVFNTEHLKAIGFTDSDCEAVAELERALQTGHHPKEPYQPIGKPYMIDFAKVTQRYFEYLKQHLVGQIDERCPSVGSIKRGLLELMDILQGKGERGVSRRMRHTGVAFGEPCDRSRLTFRLPKRQPSEGVSSKGIAVAPAIQEPDQQEKVDELLVQLKPHRRRTIKNARKKGVPLKALIHAAALFLSDDMDDWTAATDTIYSFTSPYGLKQLQYPNKAEVFVPDFNKRLKGRDNP